MDSLLLVSQDGQEITCPPSLIRHSTLLTTTSSLVSETIEHLPLPFEKDSILYLFQILEKYDLLPFITPRVKVALFESLTTNRLIDLLTLVNFLDIECLVDPLSYILASKKREGRLLEEEYEDIYRKCYDKLDHYANQVTLPYTLYDYMKEMNTFEFPLLPLQTIDYALNDKMVNSVRDSLRAIEKLAPNGMVLNSQSKLGFVPLVNGVNNEIYQSVSINSGDRNIDSVVGFDQMHISHNKVTLDISNNTIPDFLDFNGKNCFSLSSNADKITTLILSYSENFDWSQLDPLRNLKHLIIYSILNDSTSEDPNGIALLETYVDKRDLWLFYKDPRGEDEYIWRAAISHRSRIVFHPPLHFQGVMGPPGPIGVPGPIGEIGPVGEIGPMGVPGPT